MRPGRAVVLCLVAAAFVATVPAARANGRFPAANQLVAAPGDASRMLLRATFGLLLTTDRGRTWDWVCESAIGFQGDRDPAVALFANGRALAGLPNGLSVSDPAACDWRIQAGALDRQTVVDVALVPGAPRGAVALTGTNVGEPDGGARYVAQVFETADDGETWRPVGAPLDPGLSVETVDVAATDPDRFYVSAASGTGAAVQGWLLASSDHGATWRSESIPLVPGEEPSAFIAAIDPTNADRVYVRTRGRKGSRLLVTDDSGKTFRAVWSGGSMLGFALSADGSTIYLGGPDDGVQRARRAAMAFEQVARTPIGCLMHAEDALYACSTDGGGGFIVGVSRDEGVTFAPLLRLHTVNAPLACPPSASASKCLAEWPALRDELAIGVDAGVDADAGGETGRRAGGCGSAPPVPSELGALVVAIVGAARALRGRLRRG